MEIDPKLASQGYVFEPSKYTPGLGYARLSVVISGKPTQRYFDVKSLRLPTYDGRFYHQTSVTRHELAPEETFQVCLGQLTLETYRGESLHAFSFGGRLDVKIASDDLFCELTSDAPIFKLRDDAKLYGGLLAAEIMEMLAEKQARLPGHGDELYSRLAQIDPYALFLACLVSLRKRADSIPMNLRRDQYQKVSSEINRGLQTVRNTNGWDGSSPTLDELLSEGGK